MSIPVTKLIERYEHLSTPVVYDILDTMGYPNQALSAEIRPISPDMRVAGPAFTLEGRDHDPNRKETASNYQMWRDIVPNSVLVRASHGHRVSGPWGENTSITARTRGARGIIMEDGTRDVEATVKLGFPTFCRYVTPVFGRNRYQLVAYQQPIQMMGQVEETVLVTPGDFVIADRDGVVIVPQALIEEVLMAAERLEEIEEELRAGLIAGEDREEVYKRHPKFDHVRKPNS